MTRPPCLSDHDSCRRPKPCVDRRKFDRADEQGRPYHYSWLSQRCSELAAREDGWQEPEAML